jgi:hypothetical protein
MLHRKKISAFAGIIAVSMALAAPAGAGIAAGAMVGGERAAPRVAASDAAHPVVCEGCAATLDQEVGHSPTRSVNLAILALGSLWLTLMVRRIQMRASVDGIRRGARPHAATGR